AEGGSEFVNSLRVAAQTIVGNAQFTMRKVITAMHGVGTGVALVIVALPDGRLKIGQSLVPVLAGGVGAAAVVVVPPARPPGLPGGDAVLLAVLYIDLAGIDGTAGQVQEKHTEDDGSRRPLWQPHCSSTSLTFL